MEVRRKRTYVKRSEAAPEGGAESNEPVISQSELEARRIQEEENARKEAEEKARTAEAERKAEAERRADEEEKQKSLSVNKNKSVLRRSKRKKRKAPPPQVSAADIQAKEQSEQRGGKRSRGRSVPQARLIKDAGVELP